MAALFAALSGAFLALCFPNFELGLLSLAALVPLLVALHPPGGGVGAVVSPGRAFRLGYLTGAVFFLVLLHWIPRLPRENVTIPYAMVPALGLLVAYLSLYPALAAAAAAWLGRRGVPIGLSLPVTWTLAEAVRGTGVFGFPWGAVGYAFAPYPHLVQFVSITGVWGASFWALLVNGLAHGYLSATGMRRKLPVLLVLLVVVGAPYVHGRFVLAHRRPGPLRTVGLVQPNVGNDKWEMGVRDSVVTALLDQTRRLVEEAPVPLDLVVWPETAIPVLLPRDERYRHTVEAMVDSLGVPLLAGFPDGFREGGRAWRFFNAAGLILPGRGMVNRYDKRHLVPFSEYFPLPILNRFDFGQSDFTAGRKAVLFEEAGPPFGVLICFESIFPALAREYVGRGARYLVNITNDQWFGDSPAPRQHFAMNVFRCIENRVGLARAANTGISAVIDPYGFVTARTETFRTARLVATVELGQGRTFYTRTGDWILAVLAAALVFFVLVARRRKPA